MSSVNSTDTKSIASQDRALYRPHTHTHTHSLTHPAFVVSADVTRKGVPPFRKLDDTKKHADDRKERARRTEKQDRRDSGAVEPLHGNGLGKRGVSKRGKGRWFEGRVKERVGYLDELGVG